MSLQISNLSVKVGSNLILKAINLEIKPGEIHALMGPNGSGKSTLANSIMGHPKANRIAGKIILDKKDISSLPTEKRAQAGVFMAFQQPVEISGVSIRNFLRLALLAQKTQFKLNVFQNELDKQAKALKFEPDFLKRSVNEGLSGGEKKRLEILQLLMLKPKYAILDEIDSGLDIDALKTVAQGMLRAKRMGIGLLVITHYSRILKYLLPKKIHILVKGQIVKTGSKQLAEKLEKSGYQAF
ncbi:MAG: Fe-S cluster assembly ATPase SufC [Patescibacteria group bacterium]|jgi:Fe-S cluster assembly ATP-binding protein